jgi:Flp pilus assembly protein TadG
MTTPQPRTNPAALRRSQQSERSVRGNDRGSATVWALGMILIGLLAAGLVVDGGAAMTAKVEARQIAQQAARRGADQLDLAALRGAGTLRLDPAAAEAAARDWLTQAGVDGTVTATTDQVTVTVTVTTPTVLLAAVGVDSHTVVATGVAEPTNTAAFAAATSSAVASSHGTGVAAPDGTTPPAHDTPST